MKTNNTPNSDLLANMLEGEWGHTSHDLLTVIDSSPSFLALTWVTHTYIAAWYMPFLQMFVVRRLECGVSLAQMNLGEIILRTKIKTWIILWPEFERWLSSYSLCSSVSLPWTFNSATLVPTPSLPAQALQQRKGLHLPRSQNQRQRERMNRYH